MEYKSDLQTGLLVKRYKRFLADVTLDNGETVTAHCANPGKMTGLAEEGMRVWLERSDDPKRKLAYSWRLVSPMDDVMACIDTSAANRVVGEALEMRKIDPLKAYDVIRPEVKYGERSRVDFLLQQTGLRDCYLEVKSVTLSRENGLAAFPDTKTARGARHMEELAQMVREGHRAVALYLVMRNDCTHMSVAEDIDPVFAQSHKAAMQQGVEVLVYSTYITNQSILIGPRLAYS